MFFIKVQNMTMQLHMSHFVKAVIIKQNLSRLRYRNATKPHDKAVQSQDLGPLMDRRYSHAAPRMGSLMLDT